MKILHLTSDWKWTGPAEPMCIAGDALRERGHQVELSCPDAPSGERGVLAQARARGVAPALVLQAARGIRPWRDRRDAGRLRALIARERFDVVHVWHSRAHGLALRARRGGHALVRAHSDGRDPGPGERWLFDRGCDALVCTSDACAATHGQIKGRSHADGVAGAVDLERFRPARDAAERARGRALLGVEPAAPLVGVVARVQKQRRFDLLLDSMAALCGADPQRRLVVLGRGTHLETVARQPVADRGLDSQVVFAGHLEGDEFAQALRSFDVLCLLVPGSDGGCRAVLEALASGVPAVVSRRRGLSEWVSDGETGFVVDEQPEALTGALTRLLSQPDERARMGQQARRLAQERFSAERLAADLERVYRAALA